MLVCRADNILLVHHQQRQQDVSHTSFFICDSLSVLCLVYLRFSVGRSVVIRSFQNDNIFMSVYHKSLHN